MPRSGEPPRGRLAEQPVASRLDDWRPDSAGGPGAPHPRLRRWIDRLASRPWWEGAAIAAASCSLQWVSFGVERSDLVAVWPATGLVVAALLLTEVDRWPRILAAAAVGLVAGTLTFESSPGVVGLVAIDLAHVFVAAWCLRRWSPGSVALHRPGHVAVVFSVVVLAAPVVFGAARAAAAPSRLDEHGGFWNALGIWAGGHAAGAALVTPALLVLAGRRTSVGRLRWELALATVAVGAVSVVATQVPDTVVAAVAVTPIAMVVLTWPSIRLGRLATTVATLMVGVLILSTAIGGTGLFGGRQIDLDHRVGAAHILVIAMAFVQLVIATVVAQRVLAMAQATELLERLDEHAGALERSNRELSEFSYVVSHDLSAPLRAIAGFHDLLSARYRDQLDERGRAYLDRVGEGAVRMRRMIDEILAYARADAGGGRAEAVDLGDCVRTAVADLAADIDAADGRVTGRGLPTVAGARSQLDRVFLNLISNAITYRRDGVPPVVEISARRHRADPSRWVIEVADNGVGVPADQRERALRMFQRLDAEHDGTGIGLAVSKKILDGHGGRLELDDSPLGGCLVRFDLPAWGTMSQPSGGHVE